MAVVIMAVVVMIVVSVILIHLRLLNGVNHFSTDLGIAIQAGTEPGKNHKNTKQRRHNSFRLHSEYLSIANYQIGIFSKQSALRVRRWGLLKGDGHILWDIEYPLPKSRTALPKGHPTTVRPTKPAGSVNHFFDRDTSWGNACRCVPRLGIVGPCFRPERIPVRHQHDGHRRPHDQGR